MLVWQQYQSDLGRAYPMYALSIRQVNDVPSNTTNVINLLPPAIRTRAIEVKNGCAVSLMTGRKLVLWTSEGAQLELTYPQPFSQALFDFLTLNTNVSAFEFVGERLRYGRLRRLLDNVGS